MVTDEEMYSTFNMGIGMCAVVSKNRVDDMAQIVKKHKKEISVLGRVKKDAKRRIVIEELKMIGYPGKNGFKKYS